MTTTATILTDAEIVAEFKRRHRRGDVVTEDVLRGIARTIGISVDRMRDVVLRHLGVIE